MPDEALTPNATRARTFAQEYAELGHLWERDTHGLGPVAEAYLTHAQLGAPIAIGLAFAFVALVAGWLTTVLAAVRPFAEVPRTLGIILCTFGTIAFVALMRLLLQTMRECRWVREVRARYIANEQSLRNEFNVPITAAAEAPPWRRNAFPIPKSIGL